MGMKCRTNTVHSWVLEKMAEKVFVAAWSEYREEIREGCRELCRQQTYSRESQDKIRQCKKRMAKILKDVAEQERAKQEGLVAERAYKALRRSYDTKKLIRNRHCRRDFGCNGRYWAGGICSPGEAPFRMKRRPGIFGRICPRNY